MKPLSPTRRRLARHPLPAWYDDAKFGIFIHWSVSSVIGWAPTDLDINGILRQRYDEAQAFSPYTEWYENSIRLPESPAAEYHRKTYGSRPYRSFAADFEAALEHWNPSEWAEAFRRAGARYVVLVTKHHDGYCLWPSAIGNPHLGGWASKRDLVGELAHAVRAEGLRFGVYYSGGLDWTFETMPLRTMGDIVASIPGGDYADYAEAQVRELIQRVEPDVLWNDIAWPSGARRLHRLFADYYAAVPEGVVNDRWVVRNLPVKALRNPRLRRAFDTWMRRRFQQPDAGLLPPGIGHFDYQTPEYVVFPGIRRRKWECVRGMDRSFGFNRNSREEHFLAHADLIHSLADITAKNGNLLLNVGPRGEDASIPEQQRIRLRWLGEWLQRNGAAIYGTRPWVIPEATCEDGTQIRFTCRDDKLNAIVLAADPPRRLVIGCLRARESVEGTLLGGGALPIHARARGIEIELPAPLPDSPAHVVCLRGVTASGTL